MKSITQASVKNKYVLLRADLNVPLSGGKVRNEFRISKILPTLIYLQNKGAKTIVISHLGEEGESLRVVANHIAKKLSRVSFVPEILGETVLTKKEAMKSGDILILENLRRDPGEKAGDKRFAQALASLGDIYVNDAFSASHRKHASIVALPRYLPSYAGLQMKEEIRELSKVLTPKHPFVFIVGGAKISTKLPLLSAYKDRADALYVGGALANDFFKKQGYEVGRSLVDDTSVPTSLQKASRIHIPLDVQLENKKIVPVVAVRAEDKILDIGPATVAQLCADIQHAKMILMNGPLGNYEQGFDAGTKAVLRSMAESKARTIVGGGDSVALLHTMGLEEKISFVSTGGGAMLEFLAKGTLPGIQALG